MAKRLYFKATVAPSVSPAFDSWTAGIDTTQAVRRKLVEAQEAATEVLSGTMGAAANDGALIVQLVSPPLDGAQTVSGTATIISRGNESAINDNINNRGRSIRVFSGDGNTLRGTPEPVGWSASTTELSTTRSGQQHMLNGGLASVSAQDGDIIVVEFAYRGTGTGTSRAWESELGGTGTDHGTGNNDATGTVPWCEFSANLVFQSEAPPESEWQVGAIAIP